MSRPVPGRHRGPWTATILSSRWAFADQGVGKDARIGGGIGLRLHLRAGDDVEHIDGMVLVLRRLGGLIAFAPFACRHGRGSGPPSLSRTFFSTGSRWSRLWPSIGPDIIEPELLEHRPAGPEVAGKFFRPCAPGRRRTSGDGGRAVWRFHAPSGRCRRRRGGQDRPTARRLGGAIDISLSFRMTMRRECMAPALFNCLIGHCRPTWRRRR